ncbi:MAG: hypothetical protein WBE74_11450 [Terracidiphilus sp.]
MTTVCRALAYREYVGRILSPLERTKAQVRLLWPGMEDSSFVSAGDSPLLIDHLMFVLE